MSASASQRSGPPLTYRAAGVDIDAADELIRRIGGLARATHGAQVVAGIGGFASLVALPGGEGPLLVTSCDGVGTKLKVAFATGRHDTVGIDLVAMNVNDLLCCGATPLCFLDYLAMGQLDVGIGEAVVRGISEGCRQAACALVGGETAELPGFYAAGEYDLAGFVVGTVSREALIDGRDVRAGDAVIGLPSTGLHSNGYSLARRALLGEEGAAEVDWQAIVPELGRSLADELLTPTRIYVDAVRALRAAVELRAVAHITGGGLIENPPRVIPSALAWRLEAERWAVPAVMRLIAARGHVSAAEMWRTFNMGLGLLAVVPAEQAEGAVAAGAAFGARIVGSIIERRDRAVELIEA